MNDFDYEVLQKKRVAAGARHKRNGSKSRACFLPSDNLTPAQLRKLNGEVHTYNLDAPMSWEFFKLMPRDLQEQYLRRLNSRFGVGPTAIGKELFGVVGSCLFGYAERHGLTLDGKGKKLNSREREAWERWLAQEPGPAEELAQEAPPVEPEKDEPVPAAGLDMAKLALEWEGELDGVSLAEHLARIPLPAGRVRIKLEVERI